MKRKVVIIDDREEGFDSEKQVFECEGAELQICTYETEEELIQKVKDATVILFTSSKISETIISHLTECKMLIRYGTGLDTVDIEAATAKGIYVCNAPYFGAFAVAEHAFSLLLAVNRKIVLLDQKVRRNIWEIDDLIPVHSLRFRVLGIIGFGRIGQYVCKMAKAFEMRVIVYDPFIDEETAKINSAEKVTFGRLINNSDHITLHAPLTKETQHLIDRKVLNKMKNKATLINAGRGGLINENDLIKALKSGIIAGAGLDVFENEPLDPDNALVHMDNVVLSPHVAWYTADSIVNLHQEVIDNVLRVLRGKVPINAVNKIEAERRAIL